MSERTQVCGKFGCIAVYPERDEKCTACGEPSTLWEKRRAMQLLDENMGDESWTDVWSGVPASL